MKELISDKVHESAMLVRLDQTREKMQNMVNLWNDLGYRPCDNNSMLYDLAFAPDQMIQEGRSQKEMDGDGLPKVQKADYLKKLRFKDPHTFKVASIAVQQDPYSERGQGLWLIKDALISLNKKEADKILKQRSVVAQNSRQIELGEKIIKIKELFNEVNAATHGSMKVSMNELFTKELRPNGEELPVVLNIEVFRRLLNFV